MRTLPSPIAASRARRVGFALFAMLSGLASAQTAYTWNGTSGNWNDTTRWSPSGNFPGVTDTAVVSSGTVTLNVAPTIATLTFSNSTITGALPLTLSGSGSTWTNGTLSGGAVLTLLSGASLSFSASNGTLSGASIANSGTINFAPLNFLSISGTGTLSNLAGGLWDFQNNTAFNSGGGWSFSNLAGATLRKSGAGTLGFNIPLVNAGKVVVTGGLLSLDAGGASTGEFAPAAGTTVRFNSNYTLGAGSILGGKGNFQLSGGTLTLAGAMHATTFNQIAGTIDGIATFDGLFNWTGGTWSTAPNSGLTFTISPAGIVNLTAANDPYRDIFGRNVVNQGVFNWSSAYLRGGQGSSFVNATGGVFNDSLTGDVYSVHNPFGGAFAFTNDGTYIRNGAGGSYFDAPFNNNGSLLLRKGSVYVRQGGTMSGTSVVNAAAGTSLVFTNTYTVLDGAKFVGPGLVNQIGGTLIADGNLRADNFLWSGGNWSTSANSAFTTTIAAGTSLTMTAANDPYRDIYGRAVVNNGVVNWRSAYLRGGQGSTFVNGSGGLFNDIVTGEVYTVHNPFGGGFSFTNNGTYVRNAVGGSYFDSPFYNNGTFRLQHGAMYFRAGGGMNAAGLMLTAPGQTTLFTGGTFTVANGLSLAGEGNYALGGTGILDVTGTIAARRLDQSGGTLAGTNTISGRYFWSGGNWSAAANSSNVTTIGTNASVTLSAANDPYRDIYGRGVVNNGTLNWTSGYLRGGQGSTFVNGATGLINDQLGGDVYTVHNPFGGGFSFTNDGTYVRNGTGGSYFDAPFYNGGTISLVRGDLRIRAGGSMGATTLVQAVAGTHLYFNSNYSIADGARFTGPGVINQISGSLSLNGSLRADSFLWSGGDWSTSANSGFTTTIASGTTLEMTAANDPYRDIYGRTVQNNGVVNYRSGYLRGGQGSAFVNAAGGVFNDFVAGNTYTIHNPFGGSFVFTNNGLYNRFGGGTTYFDAPFNNNGTLQITGGDVQIRQGGTMSATSVVNANAGTHLYFTNNYTLADGAKFAGAGLFNQTAGTLTIDGTLRAPTFLWSGGNWSAAANSGLTTTVASSTTLTLTDTNDPYRDIYGRAVVNQGTVNWIAGYLRGGQGSTFTNALNATFNDQSAAPYSIHNPFGGSFSFVNNGTYVKSGTGTSTIDVPFTNTGTLRSQAGTLAFTGNGSFTNTGGTLWAAGGNFSFSSALNAGTGKIGGAGIFTASTVTAGGIVAPGNPLGLMSIAGNLALASTATSQFDLGGATRGTSFDAINVSGAAAFGGTLELSLVNGAYATLQGSDSLNLLSAASTSGAFTNIASGARLATTDGAGSFLVTINGTGLTLSNFLLGANTFLWAGGDLAGNVQPSALTSTTVPVGGHLAIYTTTAHEFNAQNLLNNGTIDWTGGYIRSGSNGTLTNASGAVFNDTASSHIDNPFGGGASFVFTNNGTYNKSASGATDIDTTFNNNGTVNVTSGDLRLNGGGANGAAGVFTVEAGAATTFANSYSFTDGTTLQGAGTISVTGGTLTAGGSLTASKLVFSGGFFAGTHTLHGLYDWNGNSVWSTAGTTTIASDGALTASGTVAHEFNQRAIVNQGVFNWTGGYLRSGSNGTFTNAAAATFNDAASAHIDNPYGGGASFVFTNNGTYNKTATGATDFDTTFANTGTVNIQAGELRLNGGGSNSATGKFVTTLDGLVSFTNSFDLASGTQLTGPGTYRQTGGTLTVTGALTASTLNFTGGTLAGTHTLHGSFNWVGDEVWNSAGTTTLASDANLAITGTAAHEFNTRSLVNNGVIQWTGGYLRSGSNATFTNSAAATLNDTASSHIDNPYGGGASFVVTNNGTYNKLAAGTTDFDTTFNNDGLINVVVGELRYNGGGTNGATGQILTGLGTTLTIANNYALNGGTQFLGDGTMQVTGGTLTIGGTFTSSQFNFVGGYLAGTHTLSGSFDWSGNSDWSTAGTTTIASTGTVTASGAAAHLFNTRNLVNQGVFTWTGGYLRSGSNATFTNAAGGVFNDTAGSHMDNPFGGGASFVFTNNGTYNKNVGTTDIDTTFANNALVNVQAGTLRLNGGGTNTTAGVFNTSLDAVTIFNNSYVLDDGSHLNGAGSFLAAAGTLTAGGNLTASALTFTGGFLAGTHTLHGNYEWLGDSDWSTSGTTTIASDGLLVASGTSAHLFNTRSFVNNGTVNWTAGYLRSGSNATFTNGATGMFNDSATAHVDNPFGGGASFTFLNQGTYNKNGGATDFDTTFTNTGTVAVNSGTLHFTSSFSQNSGMIAVATGATAQFDQALVVSGGTLSGNGTVVGNVTNAATIAPGAPTGQLTIVGNLTLQPSSQLLIQLGGVMQGVSYDFLSVSGSAVLDGNLSVSFTNGYQSVFNSGTTLTILSANSLSGAFANVPTTGLRLVSSDNLASFQVNFGAGSAFGTTDVVLSNFAAVPEPSTYALFGVGLASLLALRRRRR